MSTDSQPDDASSADEALAPAGEDSVDADQDGWLPPDSGAFTDSSSYPSQDSPKSDYGSYHTPPVGRPGYGPDGADYSQRPDAAESSGYPGYGDFVSVLAPKPSIIPLRPLSIGEILGGAFESLRANPKAMFVPSLVVMTIVGLISAGGSAYFLSHLDLPALTSPAYTTLSDDELEKVWASLMGLFVQSSLTGVLTMFAASILTGLLIVTVSRTVLGRKASLSDVWQRTRPRVAALIGQAIVIQLILSVTLAAIIGFAFASGFIVGMHDGFTDRSPLVFETHSILLLLLGALVLLTLLTLGLFALGCKLCLAPAALILENIGVFEGISRSWALTRGYFWRVVGIRLLSVIIIGIISVAASSPVDILVQGISMAAPNATFITMMGGLLLGNIIAAATLPFDSSVVALIYTDLRMRSEGLDVELRRAAGV
jgi:putative membrane protein